MIAIPASRGLSLRVSVTDRCQMRCRYCMPPEGVPLGNRDGILTYEEIISLAACLREAFGLDKVRITGGDPLVRSDIERLVSGLAELGIADLALTTNGLRLKEKAPTLKRAGLRRVNVSVDSLASSTFRRLTGCGDLRAVLEGIDAALDAGLLPVKLNTVVIRGVNDAEVVPLLTFAAEKKCELRFIELMPIGPGIGLFAKGFVSSEAVRRELSSRFTLTRVDSEAGSSARRYLAADAEGRSAAVGFISSCSAPFCGECSRLRVTAEGQLIGCLAVDGGISVRNMLRAGDRDSIIDAARRVLQEKTPNRLFEQSQAMASIGG